MRAALPMTRYGRVHEMHACCGMQQKFARRRVSAAAAMELLRRIPALDTIGDVRVRAGIRNFKHRLNN